MDTLIQKFIESIMTGGPQAIIALLCCVIGLLLHERKRLIEEVRRKEERVDQIVDDYYKGNITLSEALNSLRHVLFEIKGRIGGS